MNLQATRGWCATLGSGRLAARREVDLPPSPAQNRCAGNSSSLRLSVRHTTTSVITALALGILFSTIGV